jgi:transcriptional regulator with XRE-family HTH domain
MTATTMKRLKKSKEHREAFVASQINVGLPFQIRALRKQRKLNQKQLAELAGMLQPRISAMEQPGGGQVNLETLKRLAAAFDVALLVKFVPFSELVRFSDDFSPDDFAIASFPAEIDQLEQVSRAERPRLQVVANDTSLPLSILRETHPDMHLTQSTGFPVLQAAA